MVLLSDATAEQGALNRLLAHTRHMEFDRRRQLRVAVMTAPCVDAAAHNPAVITLRYIYPTRSPTGRWARPHRPCATAAVGRGSGAVLRRDTSSSSSHNSSTSTSTPTKHQQLSTHPNSPLWG